MKSFVVDTSALLRLYIPDGPVPAGADEALELAWRGEAVVFVPELGLVESAQVLHKKTKAGVLSPEESDEILESILELPLEVVGHRELLQDAVNAARRRSITVYDALFIALARERRGSLITADDALSKAWQQESTTT